MILEGAPILAAAEPRWWVPAIVASLLTLLVSTITSERARVAEDRRRKVDHDRADARLAADLARADQVRFLDDRKAAYGAALSASRNALNRVQHRHANVQMGQDQEGVEVAATEAKWELRNAAAAVELFASPETRDAFREVEQAVEAYAVAILMLEAEGRNPMGNQAGFGQGGQERAEAALQRLKGAMDRLHTTARSDLGIDT